MATNFTKVGSEIQVNLDPNFNHGQYGTAVAALSDGRFFVVFTDQFGVGADYNVVGQFVNADGTLSGINVDITLRDTDQLDPAVAAGPDGGAIIVWTDETKSDGEIEFATVSSAGTVSAEFDVLTGSDQIYNPDVAVLADGRALVVAVVVDSNDHVVFNFVNAAANGTTGQGVLEDSDGDQFNARVAAHGNNALVVYNDTSSGERNVVARFYDGTNFGDKVVVDDSPFDASGPLIAALADGRFVVMWSDDASEGLKGRFVGANGTPLGSAFTILDGPGANFFVAVAGLPDGGFVVTWTNDAGLFPGEVSGSDFGYSVLGQRFDAVGAPAGELFLVNTGSPADQERSSIAVNAAGQGLATWVDHAMLPSNMIGIRGQGFFTVTEVVNGTDGDDQIETYSLSETINGLDGNDNIRALGGNDVVDGGSGEDVLSGGDGNDTVNGGTGRDILFGDEGADNFLFNTAIKPKGSNIDTIADFSAADDTMHLDNAIFKKLKTEGALKSKWFEVGKKADDGNDFIVYNKKTGVLAYDKDGDDNGGAVKFAVLQGSPDDITAANFLVI